LCLYVLIIICFFFSSRRRHTRCYRDWSSDVCSSDLTLVRGLCPECGFRSRLTLLAYPSAEIVGRLNLKLVAAAYSCDSCNAAARSEERRVGKECRERRGDAQ